MPRTTREITPNVRARRKYTTLKHVTYFFASLLLLSWCSTLFQLFLPTQVARSEETKPEIYKIHICYTPENTPEQLRRMARSMFTVLAHLKIELWSNVVFHIFGDQLGDLNTYVDFGVSHLLHRPQLKVYLKATIHVLHERKVYSEHQKLLKEEVYVRFYIPFIIDKSVEKYLYLDTDTIVLSDITTLYNSVNLIEWTLAAGVQRASVCNLGKMLDLADERLRDLGIQDSDPCMSGGVFYVNTSRWIKENVPSVGSSGLRRTVERNCTTWDVCLLK